MAREAVRRKGYVWEEHNLRHKLHRQTLSCRAFVWLVFFLACLWVASFFFSVQLMFPVGPGWTVVGGWADNRLWETWEKDTLSFQRWWPSVGGFAAGSDKGQTANCFFRCCRMLIRSSRRPACFFLVAVSPHHTLAPLSCPFSLFYTLILSLKRRVGCYGFLPILACEWGRAAAVEPWLVARGGKACYMHQVH